MLSSIRNKIIFGTLLLILMIQLTSALLQSSQVRSIFTKEFKLGAQNLAQTIFITLLDRMNLSNNETQIVQSEDLDESLSIFIQLVQYQQFDQLLKSKEDLLRIQFLDAKGQLLVDSKKTAEGSEHLTANDETILQAEEAISVIAAKATLEAQMEGGVMHIAIPLTVKQTHLGSLVMTYNNTRLVGAERQIYVTGIILVIIFMLIALVMIVLLTRRILSQPIQKMIDLLKQLADGELNQRFEINRKDEIGEMAVSVNELVTALQSVFQAIDQIMGRVERGDLSGQITINLKGDLHRIKSRINQSIALLSETILTVMDTSQSVEESARELSKSADLLSSSSSRQAATLEQISSSIAEIENHSRLNTEYSNEAKKITDETLNLVYQGNSQMEEMQTFMDQINTTSQDVTKIIKVIDEIAFQTNLLALNAAVEAARAGKYGKGFGVVAEEVRNLAARSAEAARDTSYLIESSMKEVTSGVQKAYQTSSILKKIVTEVEKSNQLIIRIADASVEQSKGISEIYTGISQVNDSVQQNSAISEETASASDVLLNQSNSLQQEIHRFKILQMDQIETVEPVETLKENTRESYTNPRTLTKSSLQFLDSVNKN